ncbi:MAG TPA: MarR family transcriptional regulator [Bacteroidales bacterium]|nr:MarR family transcriptional regulator [Bacteroidales bacterium]HPR58495.1 MarR family transcriptional regulator [Bacteroidales bacterium]HRW95909.1 MarR family transcriptional regulator [Bacteroidales bacterium]
MDTKSIVLKTLKDSAQPLKGGDIAEKSGIEKKEVDKLLKVLIKENLIHSPKRCYYSAK